MAEHPEACPAWQEELAAWLVAQIEPEREAALLDHLRSCRACEAEAESLLAVAAMSLGATPDATPVDPTMVAPEDLGDRVVGAVRRERGVRRAMALGVLGFVLVLALSLAFSIARGGAPRLDGDPVAFTFEAGDGQALVSEDPAGSIVQLSATGLDPDLTYALWLTPPDGGYAERVAAGTFRPTADGRIETFLRSSMPPDAVGRVWVTDPAGDVALDTRG